MVLVSQFFLKVKYLLMFPVKVMLVFPAVLCSVNLLLADLMTVMCSSALIFNVRFVSPM